MATTRSTLGDYLVEEDPLRALWVDMVHAVFDGNAAGEPERLSGSARVLYLVGCFDLECANGGIEQFFSNSSGNLAHETLIALECVGAVVSKSILSQAICLFPDGVCPTDRRERYLQLCEIEVRAAVRLDELTNEYYRRVLGIGVPIDEDLIELQLAYLRTNSAEPVLTDTAH